MIYKTAAALLLSIALAAPAIADGYDRDPAPGYSMKDDAPAPDENYWRGFYIGGNIGWYGSHSRIANTGSQINPLDGYSAPDGYSNSVANGDIPAGMSLGRNGVIGGVQIGVDHQAGALVVGLEADFNALGGQNHSTVLNSTIYNIPTQTTFSIEQNWLATLRGRVGVTVTPTLLVYATGGLAVAQSKFGTSFSCLGCYPSSATETSTVDMSSRTTTGVAVGGGVEWMFAPKWSLKAEYLHADLGSHDSVVTYVYSGSQTSQLNSRLRYDMDIARVGINYRF